MSNPTSKTPDNPDRRKLTKQEELYVYSAVTGRWSTREELAVRFGVSYNTICNIVKRQKARAEALSEKR